MSGFDKENGKKPIEEMTDAEILDALADIAGRRGWTVEDVKTFDGQAELVAELKRRGLTLQKGDDDARTNGPKKEKTDDPIV